MLKIRLQRIGKKGQAYFRVVVLEHTKKPKGKFLELLGSYNPHEKKMNVKKDRIEYWISKGAQVSPTVNNLLTNYKIWDKPKVQSWKPKKKKAKAPANEAPKAVQPAPEEAKADIEEKTEPKVEEPATQESSEESQPEPTA